MSSAASCIQVDPALLTKKLTIVAAVAISATALYLLFGGPRKRTKNEDTIIDCTCIPDSSAYREFTSADEQFQDIITITTTDHQENITEAYRCPQIESHCDSLHSCSSEAPSAASGRLSSPKRACSPVALPSPLRKTFANSSTSVGVCTDPVRFRDQSHGICCSSQTNMSSYPDESPGVCPCCGETLQQDFPALQPNAICSEKRTESRVKERENIPPPSRRYSEKVLGSAATYCEGSHYVCWRDVESCESNSNSQEMCRESISNSQCQVCMNNNCEKCRLIGCDLCFPNTCSLGIVTSQNQRPDLGQRHGTNSSSSPLQQKKKVRWTPNTVEPSCDNQIYRRRQQQQQYTNNSVVAAQWQVTTSYNACEQPRLQSQAAKNTITGTRETVRKNQYNYCNNDKINLSHGL